MRSRSRTITLDLPGLWFSIQCIAFIAVVGAAAHVGLPLAQDALRTMSGEAGAHTASASVSESNLADWALVGMATTAPPEVQRDDEFTALLGAVPNTGKFIRVDMVEKQVALYEDGARVYALPILQVPAANTPDEVPEGLYTTIDRVATKTSTLTLVRFPHYVRFDDRFALHGPTTRADGSMPAEGEAEGSIMLGAEDAETAYAFAVPGVPVFVYTGNEVRTPSDDTPIPLETDGALPATTARSYVVADLESGQVYLEKESSSRYPIASITKFVTATVASGIIPHSEEILAPNGEKYTLGDLYYLLLLRSDNGTADAIASHVGTEAFIASMNTFTSSLGLSQTSFADPSGLSPKNISTARDLAHLAGYLYEQKPFVLDISSEESMTITSSSGTRLGLENQNKLAWDPHFRGGKLGFTDEALQTSLAIFSLPVDGKVRPVAVVILGSNDWKQDTRTLLRWLLQNTKAIER